jgi:hypothetical protein
MAAAVARPSFSDRVNRLVETVAERIDTQTNGRLSAYFERSTALSSTPGIFNSNPKFGVIHAVESTVTRDWTKSVTDFAMFTIDEARERLSALIDGDYIVDSFHDLIDYLKERSLALEGRLLQGKMINYLVDQKTKQSVPAAQVHPSLSYKNVKTMEMKAALRGLIGGSEPSDAFGSWQGMSMIMSSSKYGMAYTVSGDTAHFGKQYGVATADVEENLAIIRQARSEGVELILPRREGAAPGELIQGMSILRKSNSMPAPEVHPGLDHRALSLAFGQGMVDLYEEMARKNGDVALAAKSPVRSDARVVSMEEFRSRYAAQKVAAPVEEEGLGFGGAASSNQKRDIGLKRGNDSLNSLAVWDFDINQEIMMVPECLPEGKYKRFAHDGQLEGFTEVGSKGQLRHLDRSERVIRDAPVERNVAENMSSQPSYRLR